MWNEADRPAARPRLERFLGCDKSYEDASAVVFGAPFDSTTSYRPGARFGCRAMRMESYGMESYSPYQDQDLSDIAVHDAGDLELPFGHTEMALGMIEDYTAGLLQAGKRPVMLGGEHLVTLGAVRAAARAYPDLVIVHFDAHSDLAAEYLGVRLSHACVMRRCWEILGDGRIHQFGVRSGLKDEFVWAAAGHVTMTRYDLSGFGACVAALRGRPVYVTLDLDVLDPAVFPGTGTPEPGGVSFAELMTAVHGLAELRVVGADLVELSPPYDPGGVSTLTACKLLREFLLATTAD